MTDYVLTGLVKRRAEIAGEIEAVHERMKRLLTDLESIDATIIQFSPDHVVEAIHPKAFRPPKDWARHGQMARIVLNILRLSAEPMTSRDLAVEMLITRALDKSDTRLLRVMTKRIGVALRTQRENGLVRSEPGPGTMVLWEVVR